MNWLGPSMLVWLIVAIHSKERPIRACHLALMTKQASENRPNPDLASQVGLGSTWLWTRSTALSTWLDQVDSPVDLGVLGGTFPALANWARFLIFKLDSETSGGYIFFIRTPFFENSDSILRIFPRRTQWRIPFPLVLWFQINYTLIC